VARGSVFVILGGFAVLAALGTHRAVDGKDALRSLVANPYGSVLLAALAIGLMCFAFWRAAQALADVDDCGNHLKGLARRAVYAGAAIFYAGFSAVAFSILLGWDDHSNGERIARDWTAWLLGLPFGQWLLGAIGVAIMIAGIGVGISGLRAEFKHRLDASETPRRVITALGIAGYVARSFVLVIIGLFLTFSAINANSRDAKGLAGALAVIQRQHYGSVLLGVTAAGFLAFGAFNLAEAACRRISTSNVPRMQPTWLHV
jgi:uncharacterized protein DUF1206